MTEGQKLQTLMDGLNNDLRAANENRADPNLPNLLTTDFQLVASAATSLGDLTPPNDSYKEFDASLDQATATILQGTQLLGKSITNQDELAGAQAFAALSTGRSMLDAALASLPPQ